MRGREAALTCVSGDDEGMGAVGHLDLRVAEVDHGVVIHEQVDLIDACAEMRLEDAREGTASAITTSMTDCVPGTTFILRRFKTVCKRLSS